MQKRSSGSAVVRYSNQGKIEAAVLDYTGRLRSENPGIRRIIWFGSWINGIPGPKSDVDLCVILESSDKAFRDRIPELLPERFPTGLDIIPYTEEEFLKLEKTHPAWYRCLSAGREV